MPSAPKSTAGTCVAVTPGVAVGGKANESPLLSGKVALKESAAIPIGVSGLRRGKANDLRRESEDEDKDMEVALAPRLDRVTAVLAGFLRLPETGRRLSRIPFPTLTLA